MTNKMNDKPGAKTLDPRLKTPKEITKSCPLIEELSKTVWTKQMLIDWGSRVLNLGSKKCDETPPPLYGLYNPENMRLFGEFLPHLNTRTQARAIDLLEEAHCMGLDVHLNIYKALGYFEGWPEKTKTKAKLLIQTIVAKNPDAIDELADSVADRVGDGTKIASISWLWASVVCNERGRIRVFEKLKNYLRDYSIGSSTRSIDIMKQLIILAKNNIDISPMLGDVEPYLGRLNVEESNTALEVFYNAVIHGADISKYNNRIISIGFAIEHDDDARIVQYIQMALLKQGGNAAKQVIKEHLEVLDANKEYADTNAKSRRMCKRVIELFEKALEKGVDISEIFPAFVDALTYDSWFLQNKAKDMLEKIARDGNKAMVEALTKTIAIFISKSRWLGMHSEKNDIAFENAINTLAKIMKIAKQNEDGEYLYYDRTHQTI